jgi:hypothetical protein
MAKFDRDHPGAQNQARVILSFYVYRKRYTKRLSVIDEDALKKRIA